MKKHPCNMSALLALSGALLAACTGGSDTDTYTVDTGGNPKEGLRLIREFGCGSCHTIPGVRGAEGVVGPPLNFFARRTFIAGRLPNNPVNLIQWIQSPQQVDPLTAMPMLGVKEPQARHIAAYLYTLD